jgi:hypothetical protein
MRDEVTITNAKGVDDKISPYKYSKCFINILFNKIKFNIIILQNK